MHGHLGRALGLSAAVVLGLHASPAFAQAHFRREGTQILKDGAPYRAVGANKFDLALQFTGGAAEDRTLSVDMAEKDLADAADRGLPFFRFSLLGYGKEDVQRWQNDPVAFKRRLDALCDAAGGRGISLIPSICWRPAALGEVTNEELGTVIRDPGSRGYALLTAFVNDVVAHLAAREEILLWELGNEYNLDADLDHAQRGGTSGDNYSTDDMIAFVARFAAAVHAADPARPITTGYASPRTCAQHLRRSPEWTGHPDWRNDSEADFQSYVAETHPDPIDVVSMHAYDAEVNLLVKYKRAADLAGKPLYTGEFASGNPTISVDPSTAGALFRRYVDGFEQTGIALASFWDYEFFQFDPSVPDPFCMIPGVHDDLFAAVRASNERAGAVDPSKPTSGTPRGLLTAPLEGTHLAAGQATAVYVHASDPIQVERVDLLVDGALAGSVASFPYSLQWTASTPGPHTLTALVTGATGVARSRAVHVVVDGPIAAGSLATANGANGWSQIAPGALAWSKGTSLATASGSATVRILDAAGQDSPAVVVGTSPGEVDWIVPANVASGPATVTVTSDTGAVSSGPVEVLPAAPGLYSADGSGGGVAAAWIVRVRADGSQAFELVAEQDASGAWRANPVDLGAAAGDRCYLALFGTGLDRVSSTTAVAGELSASVEYAGPQGEPGLDQINVLLPTDLAGRGLVDVVVEVEGSRTNGLQISIK